MGVRAIGVNHIAFEVHDLDQTLEWYGRYFEFALRGRSGRMAWIDLGDQFIALTEGGPEVGQEVPREGSLRVRDPSGNLLEIVDYREVQFSKTPAVLRALGLGGLEKSASAREELRAKGIADE
jgi:lactoylglutathione lyase